MLSAHRRDPALSAGAYAFAIAASNPFIENSLALALLPSIVKWVSSESVSL